MSGSNSVAETDSAPIHACPICLRKLHRSGQFDLRERYRDLLRFYRKEQLLEEADWIKARLDALSP
jgi:archaemetzincin